jgi:predicted MFS family arabinose efflux permease
VAQSVRIAVAAGIPTAIAAVEPRATLGTPSDRALVLSLWPLLTASFVATLPLQVSLLFVAAIAAELGSSVAVVGGTRGLGGLTALLAGALAAPLIDRLPRARLVPAGLAAVATATLLGAAGSLPALVACYLLLGAAGAVLQPALQAASADRFAGPGAARAAAILTSVGSLTAVLAGPLLVLPAGLWGWRGDFLAIAAVCVALAAVTAATFSRRPPAGVARLGYLAAFRAVAAAPGALALTLGAAARAGVWMAYLAYLAAYLADRFAASTVTLGWIWTLGGSTFFLASIVGGRVANRDRSAAALRGHPSVERLLEASLLVVLLTAPASYVVASWPLALLLVVLLTAAQGVSLAALVSLLIRRYPPFAAP